MMCADARLAEGCTGEVVNNLVDLAQFRTRRARKAAESAVPAPPPAYAHDDGLLHAEDEAGCKGRPIVRDETNECAKEPAIAGSFVI